MVKMMRLRLRIEDEEYIYEEWEEYEHE
jgi:hypothetical protein